MSLWYCPQCERASGWQDGLVCHECGSALEYCTITSGADSGTGSVTFNWTKASSSADTNPTNDC